MKKYILVLGLLLIVGQTAIAQDFDKLFNELKNKEGVEYQSLNKKQLQASMKKAMEEDDEEKPTPSFAKGIEKMDVIMSPESDQETQYKIMQSINLLKNKKDHEMVLSVKEEDSKVSMVVKKKKKNITNVYMVVSFGEMMVMVKMSGKFKEADLGDMMKEVKINDTPVIQ